MFDNTFFLLLSRYALIPLNIATGILLARVLGPEELGKYALIIWMPSLLAGPMSLGVGNANLYFGAKYKYLARSLVANSFIVSICFSFFIIGSLFLILNLNAFNFPFELTTNHFLIPMIDLPFRLTIMLMLNLLNAWEDHSSYRAIEIAQTVSYFILCFIAIIFVELDLLGFIYIKIISSLVCCMIAILKVSNHVGLSLDIDIRLLIKSIKYGVMVQFGSMLKVGGEKFDELMIAYFLSASSLGLLSLAKNIINRIRVIPFSIGTVISPRLTKKEFDNDLLVAKTIRISLVIMMVVVLFAIIVIEPLIPLMYGDEYLPIITPLRVFLLIMIPLTIQRILNVYFLAIGRADLFIRTTSIGLITIVVLDLVLIPYFGIFGAVIANLNAMTLEALFICNIFLKYTGITWNNLLLPKFGDLSYLAKMISNLFQSLLIRL